MKDLDSAKGKLTGIIRYENLPRDRNDNLWAEIRNDCHLTLDELSVLKNDVCSASSSQGIHFLNDFSNVPFYDFHIILLFHHHHVVALVV